MSHIRNILSIVFLCAICDFASAVLPDYIKVCKRDQSTISDCILNRINELRPRLAEGIPELKVPSIEPFYIREVIPVSGDLASLHATGKDLKCSGLSNYTVKSLEVDLETFTIRAKVRFPKLHLNGMYNIDTKVLIIPLTGQGTLSAEAIKCEADVVVNTKLENRDAEEYLKITKVDISIKVKDYNIALTGLFNGDKALGDATNEVINQNKQDFLKATIPYLQNTIAKMAMDLANNIVKTAPYSELLPLP